MAIKMAAFLLASLLLLLLLSSSVSSSEKDPSAKTVSPVPITPSPISPAPTPTPSNHTKPTTPSSAPNITYVDIKDCPKLCIGRCAKHSRPNLCHRACGSCCVTCRCVPHGTSGNQEECGPCYTGTLTHGNRTKCP